MCRFHNNLCNLKDSILLLRMLYHKLLDSQVFPRELRISLIVFTILDMGTFRNLSGNT